MLMIPLIIAFVYPFGTPDEENFLNKVKQQPAVLAQRIIPLGCDQKKDTILKNVDLIKSEHSDIIVLSTSMPDEIFSKYSGLIVNLRPHIRGSEPEYQIFHYANRYYDDPERQLTNEGLDEYYPTLSDLIIGLANYVKFRPL